MLVHNIKGTSDTKPYGYPSWIRFWLDKKHAEQLHYVHDVIKIHGRLAGMFRDMEAILETIGI